MDCEAYEIRVQELEERLRQSESRAAGLEGRLKALGLEMFWESYNLVGTSGENCSRVYAALEDFGSSLAAIQHSRIDPLGVAREAVKSWRISLAREAAAIIRRGDPHAACIERMCDAFLVMESGLADVTLVGFVEAAKVDLLVYKFEVYRVFMGLSQKDAHEVAGCRHILMDWRDKDEWGMEFHSRFSDYERLAVAHDRVHDAGIEAVYCFRTGDVERAFDALGRMEAASTVVWRFLDGLVMKGENAIATPSEGNTCH